MAATLVNRLAAVLVLESTKIALDHLASHRMTLPQGGAEGRGDLARLYGETRRLRDYLNRCVSGAVEEVTLALSPPELALVVATL